MNIKHKLVLATATVLTAPAVFAADGEQPWTTAVTKINELQGGVAAVGGAILGITLAVVGFFVIKRLSNRA